MSDSLQLLVSLAHERSSDKRRALMHAIADCLFLNSQPRHDAELALFDEVMERVLDDVEPLARAELAQRLADEIHPPPQTLIRLANDEFTIAQPILTRSPALPDDVLEHIARHQSQAHLQAIAKRPALSTRLTDVLVERGNDQVVETVAANRGAQFSAQGLSVLAHRAIKNEALRQRLALRTDLPDEYVTRIIAMIGNAVDLRLQGVDAEFNENELQDLVEGSVVALADRLRDPADLARSVDELLSLLERELIQIDEAVSEVADADGAFGVARLLGARIDMRPHLIARALSSPSQEATTVICRAAGLKIKGYSAVLRLRRRRRLGGDQGPAEALAAYVKLTQAMALRVLRFMKLQQTTTA